MRGRFRCWRSCVSRITYLRPVAKHLFGRNMDVATQLARSRGLDCITLEGDQVSHKGSLTGGYYDSRRSRLQLREQIQTLKWKVEEDENRLKGIREKLAAIDGKITGAVSEMQKLDTELSKLRDDFDKEQQRLRVLREQATRLGQAKEPKDRQLHGLRGGLKTLEAQRDSYVKEIGTELLSQLTDAEQDELAEAIERIEVLKAESRRIMKERSVAELDKNRLENLLQTNLLRKREELQAKLQEIAMADRGSSLDTHQSELKRVNERITGINNRLKELNAQLDDYHSKKKTHESDIDKQQTDERQFQNQLVEETKEFEKIMSKQTTLSKKKDELTKKIRELGSLPGDAFQTYRDRSLKQLFKQLEQCNEELKKYENVNKKALDQFVSFSDQKEKLIARKEELDAGHQSILDLIDGLDQRKYESIQLTFKQVSKYFEEVLARLAPGARAQLLMRTDDQLSVDDSAGSQGSSSAGSSQGSAGPGGRPFVPLVERLTGVGLTVAFSGTDETREMQQLSGGQKSLVALALIFAIQKCDPAPFYLFDEIDAAMDPQHRKAVADMIHDLCGNAQFITTTFRRELLEKADKFYGVKFRNKVSHIDCVTKEEAADFVEDDNTHG